MTYLAMVFPLGVVAPVMLYSPVRSEVLAPLGSGILWVTSKRILFHADARSTKIDHKKIVDVHVYSDALKVEKASGRPDYFTMGAPEARYCAALIGWFKNGA